MGLGAYKMKNKKIEIKDGAGNKISFRQFKIANREAMLEDKIPQGQLIANGIFTQTEINNLVSEGKLHKYEVAGTIYFSQKDAISCFKELKNMTGAASNENPQSTGKPITLCGFGAFGKVDDEGYDESGVFTYKKDSEYYYSLSIKMSEEQRGSWSQGRCELGGCRHNLSLYNLSGEDLEKIVKYLISFKRAPK